MIVVIVRSLDGLIMDSKQQKEVPGWFWLLSWCQFPVIMGLIFWKVFQ